MGINPPHSIFNLRIIQPDIASSNSTRPIQQFLDTLDRITEARGKNLPQIVYLGLTQRRYCHCDRNDV
ncbi:MAG: hypothetical protein KAF91_11875 [Nostoc sp. TH1S01]|nr:hypothetical protein [Nostoc sp. TH1S01]